MSYTEENWELSRYHYPYRDIVLRTGEDDNDAFPGRRLICQVPKHTEDGEEQKARAHLITATPKLLTACKSVQRYNKAAKAGKCCNEEAGEWWEVVMDEIDLAIAAAEGKE